MCAIHWEVLSTQHIGGLSGVHSWAIMENIGRLSGVHSWAIMEYIWGGGCSVHWQLSGVH